MTCAVPDLIISNDVEAAYPNSILDDAHTRQAFKAIFPEEVDETPQPKLGFWRRQFTGESTAAQRRFDWLFGAIFPVICFAVDPGVFRGEHAVFARYAPAAYSLSYVAVMATMLWLLMGKRLRGFSALLSGLFWGTAVVSLVIGLVLFPFSFVGMIFIIGFLGYTPLLMSFSLFRNAVRTYRAANAHV